MTTQYVFPRTLKDVARNTRFFVKASAAMAAGGAVVLLNEAVPGPVSAAARRLGTALELAIFEEMVADTPTNLSTQAAGFALGAGLAGVPFFLAVGAVEACVLVLRRLLLVGAGR